MSESHLKIALLYGYKPSGHYMAAEALREEFEMLGHDVYMMNLSEIYPMVGTFVADTYFKLIQKTPALWGYFYDSPYISFAHKGLKKIIPGIFFARIKKFFTENKITTVISTHAFASLLASRESIGLTSIKRYCVATDIYAHSFWDKEANAYFVPVSFTKKTFIEKGIEENKIFVTGMPLRKALINSSKQTDRAKKNTYPIFFITGGNRGILDFEEIKKAFLKSGKKAFLNVLCGENDKLRKTSEVEGNISFSFFPYQNDPSFLYSSCDCVMGKPGGLTIFETAIFKKPLIVHSPLPGQEERNLAWLEKSQKCFYASNSKQLGDLLELFYRNKKIFSRRAENLSNISKTNSAKIIAERILLKVNIPKE